MRVRKNSGGFRKEGSVIGRNECMQQWRKIVTKQTSPWGYNVYNLWG